MMVGFRLLRRFSPKKSFRCWFGSQCVVSVFVSWAMSSNHLLKWHAHMFQLMHILCGWFPIGPRRQASIIHATWGCIVCRTCTMTWFKLINGLKPARVQKGKQGKKCMKVPADKLDADSGEEFTLHWCHPTSPWILDLCGNWITNCESRLSSLCWFGSYLCHFILLALDHVVQSRTQSPIGMACRKQN